MHTPLSKSRPPGKQLLDPGQTSFDLGPMPEPPVRPIAIPPASEPLASPKRKAKPASPPAERPAGPRRARISFEAPLRLNRRLERVALEKDRSKTSLLRDALEAYLKKLDAPEGEP